jgi:hypothetical protein
MARRDERRWCQVLPRLDAQRQARPSVVPLVKADEWV